MREGDVMKHKCAFCSFQTDDITAIGKHYETAHRKLIPPGMQGEHFAYYILTGRKEGSCIICHKATPWNTRTHKYHRICTNPNCHRQYGQMKGLTNPKIQQEMLANRKISGVYKWYGHNKEFQYTGSYEKDFLMFMDYEKGWDPIDILMPCPHVFTYFYDGQKRFYIPDGMIVSHNLIFEIKDGDPDNPEHNANRHPDIMRVNRVKERLKKEAVKKSKYHYMVIYNKDYRALEAFLKTGKKMYLTEGVEEVIDSALNVAKGIIEHVSIDDQILDLIDKWREYVEEKKLERYTKVSAKLNTSIYNAIKSDEFEKASHKDKLKELIPDMLSVSQDKIRATMCIMDDDTEIKSEFGDPYHVYSQEYAEAKDKLLKWKKPSKFIYLSPDVDISFAEDVCRLIRLKYDVDD
jgi:hypothetical protein